MVNLIAVTTVLRVTGDAGRETCSGITSAHPQWNQRIKAAALSETCTGSKLLFQPGQQQSRVH